MVQHGQHPEEAQILGWSYAITYVFRCVNAELIEDYTSKPYIEILQVSASEDLQAVTVEMTYHIESRGVVSSGTLRASKELVMPAQMMVRSRWLIFRLGLCVTCGCRLCS